MFNPGLEIGQILKNSEIVEIFKCGNMGGMRRSKTTNTLVIVSDYTKGIYHDKWIGGILHYTGMGGRQQILRLYRPIQYFGYRAFFANEPYVSSASAFEASTLGAIPMSLVKELIDQNRKLAWFFINELSKNLGGSDAKIVNLTQKHIRGRLADAIIALVDNYGYEDDGETLKIYMAREDLANLSNMTTSNAIRTLSSFCQEHILTVDGRRIKILNPEALRNISKFG